MKLKNCYTTCPLRLRKSTYVTVYDSHLVAQGGTIQKRCTDDNENSTANASTGPPTDTPTDNVTTGHQWWNTNGTDGTNGSTGEKASESDFAKDILRVFDGKYNDRYARNIAHRYTCAVL